MFRISKPATTCWVLTEFSMLYGNKWLLYLFCSLLFLIGSLMYAPAQDIIINQDESKVPPYTLPDPLMAADGKRLTSSHQWTQHQRAVMLRLFADNVYGRMPGKPIHLYFKVLSVDSFALGGAAIRKQVTIFFTNGASAPSMNLLLYFPKSAKKPVPVFVGLNFYGNQTVNGDTGITLQPDG
jgi:hypothetical protein